jgi:erythronate-4-phosphate dehydrogenase
MTVFVADEGLLGLAELVPSHCEIRWYSGRDIPRSLLDGADALLVRSTARVSAHNLPECIRYIGTATIGTDHLPLKPLLDRQITVVSAPGCNAFAVTDYVLSHLLSWAKSRGRAIDDLILGIVGVGAVGSLLYTRAQMIGIRTLLSDQPRFDSGNLSDHVPLANVVRQSDIISLHVPRVTEGIYVTDRLLDEKALSRIKRRALLINASRGQVLHEHDLLKQTHFDLVLDVFPNEPVISDALISRSWRISPHIAGHSAEGKYRGTKQIMQNAASLFGFELNDLDEEAFFETVAGSRPVGHSSIGAILKACPMAETDRALRERVFRAFEMEKPAFFDQIRKSYRLRRESEPYFL